MRVLPSPCGPLCFVWIVRRKEGACLFYRNLRLRAFRRVEIVLSKSVLHFSIHRQSSTGSVVVTTTNATSPLSQITSKTNLKGKGQGGQSNGKGNGSVMLQQNVGKRMLKWNSTGPRRGKERPKGPVKVSGKNRGSGLGVSPAGKEKSTSGGNGKERTGLTIEHGHFRWTPEQLKVGVEKNKVGYKCEV